ncbi:hypothetical protein B0H14DRAFT_265135 [Mycena olivaceomarginata]|nr:hypothetical protein B0H14DRAFT_265135 [Mycena olivaceomarginata]
MEERWRRGGGATRCTEDGARGVHGSERGAIHSLLDRPALSARVASRYFHVRPDTVFPWVLLTFVIPVASPAWISSLLARSRCKWPHQREREGRYASALLLFAPSSRPSSSVAPSSRLSRSGWRRSGWRSARWAAHGGGQVERQASCDIMVKMRTRSRKH